jgi:outer membrane protein
MISRHALIVGISVTLAGSALAAASALAQPASRSTTPPPPPRTSSTQPGAPRTLAEALAATYSNQPALQAERAKLRATDEGVPSALAGWRPTVVLAGTIGYGDGASRQLSRIPGSTTSTFLNSRTERDIATAQATVTQPIYTGGRTQANVNHAKDAVMAERANLITQEQSSFTNTVNAYVGVIQDQDLLTLNINNEQVLAKQLQATNDRFRVGEITRTDVAQAEAALAGATAQRQTAEGNLATARATFVQVVGYYPPADLVEPQPLALPVRTEREAAGMAAANNPNVVSAEFTDSAAKDAVDVAFAQLMPQVSLQGQTFDQENAGTRTSETNGYQVVAQVSVPLYQGGSEYSGVRQAKQTEQQSARLVSDAQRTAVQAAVQAWETLVAATAAAASTRSAIRANEVALEGVEREAIVGSRTTLDVLNAEQALLNSRVTLVQNLAQLVTASYQVAAAIGRLTARDMHLPVPLYDETAYYNAVKDKWVGLGDYATDQPGR